MARLARLEDVLRVALMPDVHLAENVCVGTVVATRGQLLPDAVGGDIGCGMTATRLDCHAGILDRRAAGRILAAFRAGVPATRHPRRRPLPHALAKHLIDEAPSAYKPIGSVMRAQRELTRIALRLRPVLRYKGL